MRKLWTVFIIFTLWTLFFHVLNLAAASAVEMMKNEDALRSIIASHSVFIVFQFAFNLTGFIISLFLRRIPTAFALFINFLILTMFIYINFTALLVGGIASSLIHQTFLLFFLSGSLLSIILFWAC